MLRWGLGRSPAPVGGTEHRGPGHVAVWWVNLPGGGRDPGGRGCTAGAACQVLKQHREQSLGGRVAVPSMEQETRMKGHLKEV